MSDQYGPAPGSPGPGAFPQPSVHISGGNVSGSAIAAGQGARAQVFSTASPGTLATIDRLLEELKDGATVLDTEQAEAVVDDADRLSAEFHHRKPDQDSISLLLGRISRRVSGVAALLATVDHIKELVAALVH
jgi:hypothetical protein